VTLPLRDLLSLRNTRISGTRLNPHSGTVSVLRPGVFSA
jgi:hypothetical protein